MNGRYAQKEEHLLTFPFETDNNSLTECGRGSCNFDISEDDCVGNNILFPSLKNSDPIIVTTAAVQSLTPGMNTDEDVIDLCVQWYIFW